MPDHLRRCHEFKGKNNLFNSSNPAKFQKCTSKSSLAITFFKIWLNIKQNCSQNDWTEQDINTYFLLKLLGAQF